MDDLSPFNRNSNTTLFSKNLKINADTHYEEHNQLDRSKKSYQGSLDVHQNPDEKKNAQENPLPRSSHPACTKPQNVYLNLYLNLVIFLIKTGTRKGVLKYGYDSALASRGIIWELFQPWTQSNDCFLVGICCRFSKPKRNGSAPADDDLKAYSVSIYYNFRKESMRQR